LVLVPVLEEEEEESRKGGVMSLVVIVRVRLPAEEEDKVTGVQMKERWKEGQIREGEEEEDQCGHPLVDRKKMLIDLRRVFASLDADLLCSDV
jgi:hypothetical protein